MDQPVTESHRFEGADGRRLVLVFAVLTLLAASFFGSSLIEEFTSDPPIEALGVKAFAAELQRPGAFVVHIDSGGPALPGTDASIRENAIAKSTRLPRSMSTPVLLYDRTGAIAKRAADTLSAAGRQRVVYLKGGTDAWVADGRATA